MIEAWIRVKCIGVLFVPDTCDKKLIDRPVDASYVFSYVADNLQAFVQVRTVIFDRIGKTYILVWGIVVKAHKFFPSYFGFIFII
tara:strand:- start:326 stop:580 length:255 start_codon:yes stop_codon:yes gene_type:complete